MGYNKDELIYLARLAEQCERYDGESGIMGRDGEVCKRGSHHREEAICGRAKYPLCGI